MKVLDLCSGIGGFSLGLERAGFQTIAFCEKEDYPASILSKHWPEIPIASDIRKLSYNFKTKQLFFKDKVIYVGSIDVICGGFPCQPYSNAGKRRGKKDDRDLWPEMFRLCKEVKPRWLIGENVAGFISLALDDVLSDLEGEAYQTQSFVIPACAVGGIHRRDRVWIIANADRKTNGKQHKYEASSKPNVGKTTLHNVANAKGARLERFGSGRNARKTQAAFARSRFAGSGSKRNYRPVNLPTESPVRHRDDGVPEDVARLKACGNAVVPHIPELIGLAILEVEAA